MKKYLHLPYFSVAAVLILSFFASAPAQKRDHLTAEEIELIRDVQEVDLRMELFVKAIERRLWAIEGVDKLGEEQKKRIDKDSDKWGALPTGTKLQLFSDIGKILNEAIDKLDDVYENEPKSELIPFAYEIIADYSENLIPRLASLAEKTSDKQELGLLETAADRCRDILDVRDTVPKPVGKRKKSKKS